MSLLLPLAHVTERLSHRASSKTSFDPPAPELEALGYDPPELEREVLGYDPPPLEREVLGYDPPVQIIPKERGKERVVC